MELYAVVGNPIEHSLSPRIHQLFAEETDQAIQYEAKLLDIDRFNEQVKELQLSGYKGINVTVPFKHQAWELADRLSPRARDAGAVNTLIFQPDGQIAGDNTDGIGLSRDLIINHQVLIEHRKILILGAGGAVRGIIGPLLSKKPELLTVANRTVDKAVKLAEDFKHVWDISPCAYEDLGYEKYDLIINGTSAGLENEIPPVPDSVLGINSVCYDLMYDAHKPTVFVEWALNRGALRAYDGLGMLVEQAAESFYVWRGLRPETGPVIELLRQDASSHSSIIT
ncbi:MAG: shikimate dehydrogenase [Gammaproteobacteria bacterium]|nr:shikimate dehydrogenase [Gammaproteobacteria bacterium]